MIQLKLQKVVIDDMKLGDKSLAVNKIIETINEIADRTNLLSLNASMKQPVQD